MRVAPPTVAVALRALAASQRASAEALDAMARSLEEGDTGSKSADELIDLAQAEKETGRSIRYLRRRIAGGELAASRIGRLRVRRGDVVALLGPKLVAVKEAPPRRVRVGSEEAQVAAALTAAGVRLTQRRTA